jgi:chromosome condensin MukBEF MukE localization factor
MNLKMSDFLHLTYTSRSNWPNFVNDRWDNPIKKYHNKVQARLNNIQKITMMNTISMDKSRFMIATFPLLIANSRFIAIPKTPFK